MAKKRKVKYSKKRVRKASNRKVSSKRRSMPKTTAMLASNSSNSSTRRKRKMSESQEFEIMKLVLDKFLWLGFLVMGFGMYQSLSAGSLVVGAWYMLAGALLLLLFLWIIVKEYEVLEGK
jgi:hypothetical protein